jgi:hypothetical protein
MIAARRGWVCGLRKEKSCSRYSVMTPSLPPTPPPTPLPQLQEYEQYEDEMPLASMSEAAGDGREGGGNVWPRTGELLVRVFTLAVARTGQQSLSHICRLIELFTPALRHICSVSPSLTRYCQTVSSQYHHSTLQYTTVHYRGPLQYHYSTLQYITEDRRMRGHVLYYMVYTLKLGLGSEES